MEENPLVVEQLPSVTLKSGETAAIYKVIGPEPEWEERLLSRLSHKGPLWDKPMQQALREGLPGLTMTFYQMRMDDYAIGNLTLVQSLERPVGILQHVFTDPEHRRKGICNHLLTALVDDFAAQSGRAMYLGTGYDTSPFHIYRTFGFEGIGTTGAMVRAFDDGYPDNFWLPGGTAIRATRWGDWPLLTALYELETGWDLRGYFFGQCGHSSYESAYCKLQEAMEKQQAQQVMVLECDETGALAGHAFLAYDEKWPNGPLVLDFFVHPDFTEDSERLLGAIQMPADIKIQSYCDNRADVRAEVLEAIGFKLEATLKNQYRTKAGPPADVHIYAFGP
jgi:GNAT superfamily N-acetyltransferase